MALTIKHPELAKTPVSVDTKDLRPGRIYMRDGHRDLVIGAGDSEGPVSSSGHRLCGLGLDGTPWFSDDQVSFVEVQATLTYTHQFATAIEASHALARMSEPAQFATLSAAPAVIAHLDRPDVGAPVDLPVIAPAAPPAPSAAVTPEAAFAGAAVAHVPPSSPTTPPAHTAPSVATAPAAAPALTSAVPELDAKGMAWDARIHSAGKTKNADQTWRLKRGADDALVAQLQAQAALAAGGVTAPPAAPVAPPVPPAPVAPAAPPVPVPPAPAPVAAGPTTFADLMAFIQGPFTADPVKAHNAMHGVLQPYGLLSLNLLAVPTNAYLIPEVAAKFTAEFAK